MNNRFEEVMTIVRELKNEDKQLRSRNDKLEKVIQELKTITGTDNYGNLKKRVEKLVRNSSNRQLYWWTIPICWRIDCNYNEGYAYHKTLECLDRWEEITGKDNTQRLVIALQQKLDNEVSYKNYVDFCNKALTTSVEEILSLIDEPNDYSEMLRGEYKIKQLRLVEYIPSNLTENQFEEYFDLKTDDDVTSWAHQL